MEPNIFDKVQDVDLKKTMENAYIDYAMSVIVSRAIPDVRDGLKPVQRRVLYALQSLGVTPDKKTKKCATIVGETMGKYHPHGDSSIYGSLVYMGQPWSMRHVLIDKQGNFGSEDGDSPAAMRYTEAKMSRLAGEMLAGINKNTVDFMPNFSNEYEEPVVLPSRFPNLLVNGATGIAVGMSTNIPPHNLREVIKGVDCIIDNKIEGRKTEIEELLPIIQGPDFPTGATILGKRGIEEAYRTGRGKIKMRAICEIEPMHNGKNRILVKELPYLVYRSRVIEKIAELVKDKRIDGITYIHDAAGKNSKAKIAIECRKDVNPHVILNQLYKHTQLQETFGVIMLCIVRGEPKILNLLEILEEFLAHQIQVVTRRTQYDLQKCEDRAHILEGLLKALDHIDEIVAIIRAAKNVEEAKQNLIARFAFTDVQAQAIVDMRLRALTGLERERLENEYQDLLAKIAYYKEILGDERRLLAVIKEELDVIADKYGEDRKTSFSYDDILDAEDLIADDDVVITSTSLGYIKRMSPENFRQQNRGGKGIKGMQTIEKDYIEDLFMTTNHHYIMFFTNMGRIYRLNTYEIPESSRTAKGTNIVNILPLEDGEKVNTMLSIREEQASSGFVVMCTRKGIMKKTPLEEFQRSNRNGLIAISLKEDDELIGVELTDGNCNIICVARNGKAIMFDERDIRSMGRTAQGVRAMNLEEGDEIVSMMIADPEKDVLIISERGYGKRTPIAEYNLQTRGGKGSRTYKITEKTGRLVGGKVVSNDDEIMIVNIDGTLIRMEVKGISVLSRVTSGVRLMKTAENQDIASFEKIEISEEEE
mgnify:CR=1 FL=1